MDPRSTRIGDAEREAAMAELGRHYEAGRLDHDEYAERLDALGTARVMPDVWSVFEDLPDPSRVPAGPWAPRALAPEQRRAGAVARRPRRFEVHPMLLVVVGLMVAGVVMGHIAPFIVAVLLGAWLNHRSRHRSAPANTPAALGRRGLR